MPARMSNAVVSLTTEERQFLSAMLTVEKSAVTEHLDVVREFGDHSYLTPIVTKLQMLVSLTEKIDQAYMRSLLGGDE